MKISEAWQKGKMIDGFPIIHCDPEDPIIFFNRKSGDLKIGKIKRINSTDFMLLSERVRIRDFTITDVFDLDDEESNIFENDSKIPLTISFRAIVKLGLARYTIQIAIHSNSKSINIDDFGRPIIGMIADKESMILDWHIITKEVNFPDDHYDGFFGNDEIIMDPENNSLAKAMMEAIPYDAIAS